MRKQKWVSAALAVTILFGGVPAAVQAETTVAQGAVLSQDKAVEIAKSYFTIPDGYQLESASQNARYRKEDDQVWMLSWRQEMFAERNSINVVIDAKTGGPLDFSIYDRGPQSADKPITLEEARAKANALIAKVSPEKAGRVKEAESAGAVKTVNGETDPNIYGFRFVREVNGVKVVSDGFNVVFDRDGNLRNYQLEWSQDDAQFAKPEGALTAEQATAKYKAALPLRLQYTPHSLPGVRVADMSLIYGTPSANLDLSVAELPVMDAKSGELLTQNSMPFPAFGPLTPLTGKPGSAPSDRPLDKDAALALAKRYLPNLDAAYVLSSSEFVSGEKEAKAWRFAWDNRGDASGKGGGSVYLTVDATTGELRELKAWILNEQQASSSAYIAWEKAKETAIQFVKTAVPTKTDRFVLNTQQQEVDSETMKVIGDNTYRFEFSYLVNGIPTTEHGISLAVDAVTGKVMHYSLFNSATTEDEYPDPKRAISEDKARDLFAQKFPLELQYVRMLGRKEADGKLIPPHYVLAYVPQRTGLQLDAIAGEWFNRNGSAADHKKIADLEGHWAAEHLQRLVDMNIFSLDEKGNVRPEEAVSRGDAMRILVMFLAAKRFGAAESKASYDDVKPTDPNYEFIETAVMLGWLPRDLKEFHPNDPMQRGELAKLIVSVRGYGELANKTNVFLQPFQDLASDDPNYGSIALAKALGLMTGDGANFAPQSSVSRAEMAVVVTRLQKQTENRGPIF